jgi:hypothetical protein
MAARRTAAAASRLARQRAELEQSGAPRRVLSAREVGLMLFQRLRDDKAPEECRMPATDGGRGRA